jgi:MFS family permease
VTSLPISPGRERGTDETGAPDAAPKRRLDLRAWLDESGLDLRNTWQVVIGALVLPAGIAVIILGWAGAAHGRVDQQQIPYLISGGILGLALVVIGCFFYWAHWLYRIYDQADLQHQEAMREQAEFHRQLLAAVAGGRVAPGADLDTTVAAGTGASYVATASGSNVHKPDCAIVANRTDNLRQVSRAEAQKMKPCRICEPFGPTKKK